MGASTGKRATGSTGSTSRLPWKTELQFRIDTFGATEVNVQAGRTLADTERGGVQMNIITKTGTNTIAGGVLAEGATPSTGKQQRQGSGDSITVAGRRSAEGARRESQHHGRFEYTAHLGRRLQSRRSRSRRDRVWFFGSQPREARSTGSRWAAITPTAPAARRQHDAEPAGQGLVAGDEERPAALPDRLEPQVPSAPEHRERHSSFPTRGRRSFNDGRIWLGIYRYTHVLSSRMVLDAAMMHLASSNDKAPQPEVQKGDIARFDAVTNTHQRGDGHLQPADRLLQAGVPVVAWHDGRRPRPEGRMAVHSRRAETPTSSRCRTTRPGCVRSSATACPTPSIPTTRQPDPSWTNLNHALYVQDKWRRRSQAHAEPRAAFRTRLRARQRRREPAVPGGDRLHRRDSASRRSRARRT